MCRLQKNRSKIPTKAQTGGNEKKKPWNRKIDRGRGYPCDTGYVIAYAYVLKKRRVGAQEITSAILGRSLPHPH